MLRRLALLCTLGLVGLAYTPSAQAGGTEIGIAYGVQPPLAQIPNMPIQVRIMLDDKKMMIGPQFGFASQQNKGTSFSFGAEFIYNFIKTAGDAVGVGGGLALHLDSPTGGDTQTGFLISPGIAGEHWFSDHFSIIAETGLAIYIYKDNTTIGTAPAVSLKASVYF